MKILSVVIPVYNTNEAYFKQCLDSLKCSQHGDMEVIVVDDGSKEESRVTTETVIKSSQLDIKYFQKENGGQNSARKYGFEHSEGEYIFFVDSDDYIETQYLDEVIQILKEKKPPILAFNYDVRTPDGKIIETHNRWRHNFQPMDVTQGIMNSDSLCLQIYCKQLLIDNKIQLAQGIRIGEDFASAVTILATIGNAYTVGVNLYHYIKYPGSTLSNPPSDSALDIVKAFDFILNHLEPQKKNEFHEELEWLAILHVLYYGTERILGSFSGDKNYIMAIRKWLNQTYPCWKSNKYLSTEKLAQRRRFKMAIKGWLLPIQLFDGTKRFAKKKIKR